LRLLREKRDKGADRALTLKRGEKKTTKINVADEIARTETKRAERLLSKGKEKSRHPWEMVFV